MPSLKDLKNRINSVKSTRKITSAMKMVAAAKLRRAQEAAEAARPFAERMENVLGNLSRAAAGKATAPKLLAGTGSDQVHLLIVATSERGLCGGFNTQIVRQARLDITRLVLEGKTVKILNIGKKGRDQLRRDHGEKFIEQELGLSDSVTADFASAQHIASAVLKLFDEGGFDVATLYFNRFQSVLTQVPTALQLIPAQFEADESVAAINYEYEPDEDEILAELLPRNVATQILRALLENAASEQGARMSAMDNATRNAGEMIDRLTIVYNRSRQAAITKELIEIISGAEAL